MQLKKCFRKIAALTLVTAISATMLTGCGKAKYDTADAMFTDVKAITAGDFTIAADATIKKGEEEMSVTVDANGVIDAGQAVFSMKATSADKNDTAKTEIVDYEQVYAKDCEYVHMNLIFFLYEACGTSWEMEGTGFSGGTNDNSVAGYMSEYFGSMLTSSGAEEFEEVFDLLSNDIKQEDSEVAVNVSGNFKKGSFDETVDAQVRFDDYEITLKFKYTLKENEVTYSSTDQYVSLRTAAIKLYNAFETVSSANGIFVPETEEITSHVIDGSSLIVEGIDEEFYKCTWDNNYFTFDEAGSKLELGQWSLAGNGIDATIVFSMFNKNVDSLIQYYEDTYGDNMTVTYTSEAYAALAGDMTHINMDLTMEAEGHTYNDNMFLYEVGEGFLIQGMISNNSAYTDEELIDAAFASFEIYQAE